MTPVLVTIAVLVCLGYWAYLGSGFSYSFLRNPAGSEIGFSFLPFASSDPYWWSFAVGLSNTLIAAAIAITLATSFGFVLSLARSSHNLVLAGLARLYTDVIRNIPVILQAMFWYSVYLGMPKARDAIDLAGIKITNRGFYFPWFSDPLVVIGFALAVVTLLASGLILWGRARRHSIEMGVGVVVMVFLAILGIAGAGVLLPMLSQALVIDIPEVRGLNFQGGVRVPVEFAALTTALVFYRGAYMAEVFRAGFRAVSPGHVDAAYALSLNSWTTLTRIRLPLALITILPPLTSEFIVIVKITSIGLLVGFADLYSVSVNATTSTGKTLEIMALMTTLYLIVNFTIVTGMNAINRRIAFKGGKRV